MDFPAAGNLNNIHLKLQSMVGKYVETAFIYLFLWHIIFYF